MVWVLRFVAAGTAVTLSGMLSKSLGPRAAGMVLAFPFVIGTGLAFSIGSGREQFRSLTLGVLLGLGPLLLFALTVLLVARRLPSPAALVLGVGVWLVAAGAVQCLK